jgi:hypothetical protein
MIVRQALRWMPFVLVVLLAPGVDAQVPPSPAFVSVDNYPYGPGDRSMTARIKLQAGETTANVESWVVYAESRDAVVNGQIGGAVAHGKAKTGQVDSTGIMTVTFVFPHTDHLAPNLNDRNAQNIKGGKKLYYKWIKRKGTTQVASDVVEFRMPDKLTIVNFGDSYASGEGAPYAAGPKWGSTGEQCHRSSNSGQAKAVKAYKTAHPETAIAFLNVACSGAGVRDGITGSQKKKGFFEQEDFPTRVKPQYEQAKKWLDDNNFEQLNIAIVSIVGNDVGFGPLVTKFLIEPGNLADANDGNARRARENVTINIRENIPLNYDELKDVFDANFDYDRVLVTAYPDPTRDKEGQFCGKPLTVYGFCWGPVEALNNEDEFAWAFRHILTAMNNAIGEKVRSFAKAGWVFLDDGPAKSQRHGMCNCDVPYINTIGASLLDQNDPFGTMHPNRRGHERIYLPIVRDALKKEILKIRMDYAKEHARDMAIEKARRKAAEAAAKARITQRRVVERQVVDSPAKFSAETLQKARETAAKTRRVEEVRDEADDKEDEK